MVGYKPYQVILPQILVKSAAFLCSGFFATETRKTQNFHAGVILKGNLFYKNQYK